MNSTLARAETQTQKPLAAAGGSAHAQLAHLKAHLAFQAQTECNYAPIDWCTIITRRQSRDHITRALHSKINAKTPGFHGPGKLDTEDGQDALQNTARYVRSRVHHGGNGFNLIGWNLQFRMYRERSRRRGFSEQVFWEMVQDECNRPRIEPKERSFPQEIQYRLALRRHVAEIVRRQGASPRRHRQAFTLQMHHCPASRTLVPEHDADENHRCPNCTLKLYSLNLTEMAFDPGEEAPLLIAPGPWLYRAVQDPWRRAVQDPWHRTTDSQMLTAA